jgi:hypothetical protein
VIRRVAVVAPAALGIALAAGAWLWPTAPAVPPSEPRFTQLTFDAGRAASPAIAPDGAELAYTLDDQLVVQRFGDHRGLVILPDLAEKQADPAWSPDGQQLAFATPTGLWVCGALGESPRRVLEGSAGHPSWTPDGRSLVYDDLFLNAAIGGPRRPKVWTVPVSGGTPARVGEVDGAVPAVAPDGRHIATTFTSRIGVGDGVGPSVEYLPAGMGAAWSPVYAADGRSMRFVAAGGGSLDVWQVPVVDGLPTGEPVPLTTGNAGFILRIASAPDDRFVVAERYDRVYDVVRVDLGATPSAHALTHSRLPIVGARIAADGGRVLFHTRYPAADEVFVMNADGSDLRRIARLSFVGSADWSPDGTRIAAAGNDGTGFGLWSLSADGAAPQPIPADAGAGMDWLATGAIAQVRNGQEVRFDADGKELSVRPLPDPKALRTFPSQDDRWRIVEDGHAWRVTDADGAVRVGGPDATGRVLGAWDARDIAWLVVDFRVHRVDPVVGTDDVVFDLSPWGTGTGFAMDVADDGSWLVVPIGFEHSELWRIDR